MFLVKSEMEEEEYIQITHEMVKDNEVLYDIKIDLIENYLIDQAKHDITVRIMIYSSREFKKNEFCDEFCKYPKVKDCVCTHDGIFKKTFFALIPYSDCGSEQDKLAKREGCHYLTEMLVPPCARDSLSRVTGVEPGRIRASLQNLEYTIV